MVHIRMTHEKILLWDFTGMYDYSFCDENFTIGCTYDNCGDIDLMRYLILKYAYECFDENYGNSSLLISSRKQKVAMKFI